MDTLTNLHLKSIELCSLGCNQAEDQRPHDLVSLRLPLPGLPVLKRHNIASANQEKAPQIPVSGLAEEPAGAGLNLLVSVGEEELEDVALGDDGVTTHPTHPGLQLLHPHPDEVVLEPT